MNVGTYLEKKKGNEVFSIGPDNTITECVDMLNEKKVGALVVTDDSGSIQGIVSERDILRNGCGCANTTKKVKDIMTDKSKLITTGKDANILDIMKKLDENKIRHLPVMDGDKILGVLSITDVINELNAINAFENEQLKNYILSPY